MFDELRQGVQDIASLTDPTMGEIRMGGSEHTISAIYSPVVHEFSAQYPRMSFHIIVGDLQTMSRELDARHIDFVVSRMYSPPSEEHSVEVLFEDPLVVVTGPDNPLARRRRIEFSELLDEPWTLQPRENNFWIVRDGCPSRCRGCRSANHGCHDVQQFARRDACDRPLPHNGSSLLGLTAAQAPIAQGPTGGFSQYASQGCDHYTKEPVSQPSYAGFHRQGACDHEATDEGKIIRCAHQLAGSPSGNRRPPCAGQRNDRKSLEATSAPSPFRLQS
jgi:hypothetical protein